MKENPFSLLKDLNLNTVCQQALCPNILKCFAEKYLTFLILGKVCTRNCNFCAIKKGRPQEIDKTEPSRVAEAANRLNLFYVVITSVTRDDLPDGGAHFFAETISCVKQRLPYAKIEVLIPDFLGDESAIKKVVGAKPDIIGHNLETVSRLYSKARQLAGYSRSLKVLEIIKRLDKNTQSKSGIMLGLGESEGEILKVFKDLRNVDCDFLSIGQYLSPSENHFPVKEYILPEKFDYYKEKALQFGFRHVESAPYVRSSYLASEYLN